MAAAVSIGDYDLYQNTPSLTIRGGGSLTVTAADGGNNGISVANALNIIEGADISVFCPSGGVGIYTIKGEINIRDSTVKVKIADGPIYSAGAIRVAANSTPPTDLVITNSHVVTVSPNGAAMTAGRSILITDSDVAFIARSHPSGALGALTFNQYSGGVINISGGSLYAENLAGGASTYEFDIPFLSSYITAADSAVIYYNHGYPQLIQNGDNVQYTNCRYDPDTDTVTAFGNAYVMGTIEWNDHIVFGDTTTLYGYNQILSTGENVNGNIMIPSGTTVTIPSGAKVYNLGTLTNHGTLNIDGIYYNYLTGTIDGSGAVNGLVLEYNTSVSPKQFFYVAHGDAKLSTDTLLVGYNAAENKKQTMTVLEDAVLTIQEGCTLDASQANLDVTWETLSTYLSKEGEIVVNGTLLLPPDAGQEQIDSLDLSGTGEVISGDETYYPVAVTGGTADKSFVKAGELVTLTPSAGPNKRFNGWTASPSVEIDEGNTFVMPGQAVSVAAGYDTQHIITFDSQGGSAVERQSVFSSDTVPQPEDPTRDGYAFDGWYRSQDGSGAKFDFSASIAEDLILYAKWSLISVSGVSLDRSELSLKVGETAGLTADVVPSGAADKGVTWESSDPMVAVVDGSGKVTAAGAGSATITVKTNDGGFTAECSVTVTEPSAAHTHRWAEEWSSDGAHHWHKCDVEGCGLTDSSQMDRYGAHTYDDEMDAVCNVCGYERTMEPHTHVWAEEWSTDSTHHWHACTAGGCGLTDSSQMDGYEAHRYDGVMDTTCNVCGYVWIILPKPDLPTGDENVFQLVMTPGISEVPAGLRDMEELNTPAKLEAAMKAALTQVSPGIPPSNTASYLVTLMVSTDGGATWTPAPADNFPVGGMTVTLPYPEGTDSSGRFTVVHMFTTSNFGKTPGKTESPAATNTAEGIRFTVTGLSPIMVGWEKKTAAPAAPSHSGGGGSGGSSVKTYAMAVECPEHGKVTSSRADSSSGRTITLTAAPDSGYALNTLTVTDSRGNEVKLTNQGSGKYAFTMPSGDVTVKAAFAPLSDGVKKPCDGGADCPSRGFSDLGPVGTWYHEAVDFVLRNGLMN
ncbi:MAG: InlB B-repeat-containing protein, partial [Oscillospiraceae bacterium]|nr:InlB B-repeat-containing protein [Oscillospiraceae bacterium]